jgi:hypothetical protein
MDYIPSNAEWAAVKLAQLPKIKNRLDAIRRRITVLEESRDKKKE